MFDIESELKEVGLTKEQYEQLLEDISKKTYRNSDDDWAEICERYGLNYAGDVMRKACTPLFFGSVFVKQYYDEKNVSNYGEDYYLKKLGEKKRELERERIKYRDERNEWQKQNRSNARIEANLNLLEEELKKIGSDKFSNVVNSVCYKQVGKELIVCLSDLHIGQTFDSKFGTYNSTIAYERLQKYLEKVISIGKLHNVSTVRVVGLGDQISGSIHKTIQISNRENVIEQIKIVVEIVANFCAELSKYFNEVLYYDVSGNHTRIDKKEDAVHSERLDDLVGWGVSLLLHNIENFKYVEENRFDTGLVAFDCCGRKFIACHGDFDPMTKQGVADLSMMMGYIPYAILRGHMHYPAMNELNGVNVIQSGSLAGAGDDYTIEKRLTGLPSQTVLVCNEEDGIECIYNVKL